MLKDIATALVLLVAGVCLLLGGMLIIVNFLNDEPSQIREAVLGVGLFNAGIFLSVVVSFGGKLSRLIEEHEESAKILRELAVRQRRRDG